MDIERLREVMARASSYHFEADTIDVLTEDDHVRVDGGYRGHSSDYPEEGYEVLSTSSPEVGTA